MFKCPGCEKDVSRQAPYRMDKHGRLWHGPCWADNTYKQNIKNNINKVTKIVLLRKEKEEEWAEKSKWKSIRKHRRAARWRKIINFLKEI